MTAVRIERLATVYIRRAPGHNSGVQWYYSDGTNRLGPVDEATFSGLIRAGTIRADTLVWREGMQGWERCDTVDGAFAKPTANTAAPGANPNACAECGRAFPPEELVAVSGRSVCAECKPAFLQRLREGAPMSAVGASLGMFQKNGRLVVEVDATPPNRCMYCNAPGTWVKRRKFYWYPPWVNFLVLCNLLILIVVALVLRKSMAFDVVLCEEHAAKRRRGIAIGWGLFGLAIAVMAGGFVFDSAGDLVGWAILGAAVLAIAGLVVGMRAASVLTPARIGKRSGLFRRAGKDYIAGFPEWPGDIV